MRAIFLNEDYLSSHNSVKKYVSNGLYKIHNDFKSQGFIGALRNYDIDGTLSMGYLRKLVSLNILVSDSLSKKTARYRWNGPENPNYDDLAEKILRSNPPSSYNPSYTEKYKSKSMIETIVKLALQLNRRGLSEQKIIEEIINMNNKINFK